MAEEQNTQKITLKPRASSKRVVTQGAEGKILRKRNRLIGKKKDRKRREPRMSSTISSKSTSLKTNSQHKSSSLIPIKPLQSSLQLSNLIPFHFQAPYAEEELSQIWHYFQTIGEHLLKLQAKYPLPPLQYSSYFGRQQRIRCITLISNHCSLLSLSLQTQFLAIDIFHRICTSPSFQRYQSILKAAASLYIAAKYEQICPPKAEYFSNIDPLEPLLYENIVRLQAKILLELNFNMSRALPLHFMQLLIVRYGISRGDRELLLRVCLQGVMNEDLWLGGGSLLAMAVLVVVMQGARTAQLQPQLSWRVDILLRLLQE